VRRLRESGAVLVGKATTNEFACGPPDESTGFAVPHNPWNTAHTADGSSSGSGIAVATGMALGALGTDTGGSIRGPAAANGITGLKPTFGLVSRTGVVALSHTLDTVGPMARSAHDCALLLDVIAGHDADDQASADPAISSYEGALTGTVDGVRIGVAGGYFDPPGLDAEARTAMHDVVDVLASSGADVRALDIELAALAADANLVTIACEAFARHRELLVERWDDYGVHTRRFLVTGAFFSASDYLAAQRVRTAWRRELARLFQDVDVIVTPSSAAPAAMAGHDEEFALEELNFDAPWNLVGLPAIALPCGISTGGLPLSVQFVGRPFAEADVLRVADAYQRRTGWHLRVPT
jgi:aspartyl-tRNA(Asn)/glutamyl-tRNA(Gln) amidotransferase subunit A